MVYGLLALACAVALHIHSAYRPDIGVRVCLMSALTGGAAMAVPLMVARDRDRRRRPVDLALAASFLVFGLLIGARIPLALWRPIQGDAHGLPVDLFLLAALQMFMQVFWGVGLVSIHAERVMKQLQDLSNTDELSGLGTRRAVERALAREMERASRTSQPLSVLMLDIDHFKAINDCYGHLAGDAAIRQVGRTITGLLRPYDMAGRFGGDEFCILLPHTAVFQGQSIAQRLCRAEYQVMRDGGEPLGLTVSVGVAAFDPADADPHALIRAADAALYRAKRGGRNQVVSA
ncbi:MAG: GGDEF domain-containing protein [Azospirillaceae bacterium]|nr:GGDEF domain-containing protein [Azospirillaceae bacterium]